MASVIETQSMVETQTMVETELRPRANVTLERVLYVAAWAMGLLARLYALGAAPLSPLEAANTWPTWLKALGLSAPTVAEPTSALMYSLQLLLFWLVPAGDAWARLPAMAAGMALLLLPWFLRDRLGRSAALALTFLLAVDPWLVAFSRLADGTMLALLWAMLALVALERVRVSAHADRSDSRWRWLQVLAVALGLLVVSGAAAWPLLLVVGLNVLLLGRPSWDGMSGDEGRRPLFLLVLGGGAALLGGTAWLAQPAALSYVGSSLTWWWQRDGMAGAGYSSAWLWLRLLVEQPLVLLFGTVGLVLLWRDQATRRVATFLTAWLVLASLLLLLPSRDPVLLPAWALPGLIAAAVALARWPLRVPPGMAWSEAALLLLVTTALLLSTSFWLRIFVNAFAVDANALAIMALLLASVVLILIVYALWSGWPPARWATGVLLLGLLVTAELSAMWHLAHEADPMHPDGFFASEGHPDVRQLATELATLSAQRTGDAGELPVQVQMTDGADPLLGWYLRDMRRLEWVLAPDPTWADESRKPALITLAGQALPESAPYMGGVYSTRTVWEPGQLTQPAQAPGDVAGLQARADAFWRDPGRNLARWILYRETPQIPPSEDVTLWVAADAQ